MSEKNYNEGEIVEVQMNSGVKEMVLIKCYCNYATALPLMDKWPYENGIAVRSRGMMYADMGRMSYVFYDKIIGFVRKLSDEDYDDLMYRISETLGLCMGCKPQEKQEEPEEKIGLTEPPAGINQQFYDYMYDFRDDILKMVKDSMPKPEPTTKTTLPPSEAEVKRRRQDHEEKIAAMAERDVYKELYFKLLDGITKIGG